MVVLITDHVDYNLVFKEVQKGHEIIEIRVENVTLGAVYLRVHVDIGELVKSAMERIKQDATGPVLVIGDLIARNPDRCTKINGRGRASSECTDSNGWNIFALTQYTFRNSAGRKSKIDLVVSRSCGELGVMCPLGIWDGASDRAPMLTEVWIQQGHERKGNLRIAESARLRPAPTEKALGIYEDSLDEIAVPFEDVKTIQGLESAYKTWWE